MTDFPVFSKKTAFFSKIFYFKHKKVLASKSLKISIKCMLINMKKNTGLCTSAKFVVVFLRQNSASCTGHLHYRNALQALHLLIHTLCASRAHTFAQRKLFSIPHREPYQTVHQNLCTVLFHLYVPVHISEMERRGSKPVHISEQYT